MTLREQTVEELIAAIASENISPAGGSVVATTGAFGAALCEMAYLHVLNDGEAHHDTSELRAVREQLESGREKLLRLAEQDAQVIQQLFDGSIGQADDAEVKRAVGVPMAIAEACLAVLETADRMGPWQDRAVAADATTGLLVADAALRAALLIVEQNLELLSDPSYTEDTRDRAAEIRVAAATAVDSIPFDFGRRCGSK